MNWRGCKLNYRGGGGGGSLRSNNHIHNKYNSNNNININNFIDTKEKLYGFYFLSITVRNTEEVGLIPPQKKNWVRFPPAEQFKIILL